MNYLVIGLVNVLLDWIYTEELQEHFPHLIDELRYLLRYLYSKKS